MVSEPEQQNWLSRTTSRVWSRVALPVDRPTEFTEHPSEIAERLRSDDPQITQDIQAIAQDLFDEPYARAEGAERRATTLLGALAIAASFGLAGAGLLLDVDKIPERGWRTALAIGYLALVVSLVGAAFRALETLKVRWWTQLDDEVIYDHASRALADGRVRYAAELLHAAGRNRPVARWKVAQLRAAAWWLSRALVVLLAIAFVVVAYVLIGKGDTTMPERDKGDSGSRETPIGPQVSESQATEAVEANRMQGR